MSAANTDKFTEVGSPGTATTLDAPGHTIGGTTLTVISTTNWPTTTGAIFAMDEITIVNGEAVRTAGTYRECVGVVTGPTSIGSVAFVYGADRNYPAGSTTRVYIPVSSSRENRLVQGLVVSHNQDGTMISNLPLTTPKITTGIKDSAGNSIIPFTGSSSTSSIKLATTAVGPTYIESGCVWTGDSLGSTKAASMTAGIAYINGVRLTVAAVTGRTFTASKDVYVGLINAGDGTATVIYYDNTTNAASPALATAAYSMVIAIIIVGASNIASATLTDGSVGAINQGSPFSLLPIASSVAYSVTDSIGNLICSHNPYPTLIGYRQIIADFTSTAVSTDTDVTGLAAPAIVPTGRRIKLTLWAQRTITSGTSNVGTKIFEGATQLSEADQSVGSNLNNQVTPMAFANPSAGLHTYKGSINQGGAGTMRVGAFTTHPAFISVELV